MTEVQKVSICKYCQGEITWSKDAVTGRNYPKNLNGSPHLCQKNAQKPVIETATQIAQEKEEYNRKAAAAGFQMGIQPTAPKEQANTGSCTSPDKPVLNPSNSTGLKTVEGQIVTLDIPAHKIWLKDRNGDTHYFIWGPALHDQMSKLKQWWFCKLTGEYEKDVDLWRLDSQEFFKRPDDWPFKPPAKGGYGAPRNERIIVLQTCMKAATDMRIAYGLAVEHDGTYAEIMAEITAEAITAADALCKAGGVA